ncbi:asparaginase [Agromyces seonyuensis]|uniref:Asparaginase n=1 Tax=Agromyces seonyuensis TaxID=2662446 RepID=A0A6I4NWE3_9MICO|nr:asparaginase [Agromyces seonyuensis]MWB98766.1 asparaginase [Agromyces seonyuensis]
MAGTISTRDAVELAVVERSGFVESRHAGSAVVLSPEGEVIRELGDITTPILPRSTLKPFQALAVLTSGVTLRGEDAAIATASHSGTAGHVALAKGILDRAGVSPDALQCPPAWPQDSASRDQAARAGVGPQRLTMNCSGKHSAMLAACVANGWPTDTYLELDHPLQKRILELIERLASERPVATAIDGCGAPVHALSLGGLARGIQKVTSASSTSPFALFREAAALTAAVREHPWVIAGPGQPDTIAIERLGVFAKGGAEGVMVATSPDGTTLALKMLDGSPRATMLVALRLFVDVGVLPESAVDEVLTELDLWITGGGARVGRIRSSV